MPTTVTWQGTVRDPDNNAVAGATVEVERDDGGTWVAAGSGASAGSGDYSVAATGMTDPDDFRARALPPAGSALGPSEYTYRPLADLGLADVDFVLTPARQCFRPLSSWVGRVCWVPWRGVQVQFHRRGVPRFECYYPGTRYEDYVRFRAHAASPGRWVHAFYLRRPYVPVPIGS
jgi:hypothetical protein